MRSYLPLSEFLPGYTGELSIDPGESYLQECPRETRDSLLSYIGFKAQELKFTLWRWPENLDMEKVKQIFTSEFKANFPTIWEENLNQPLKRVLVIGGGHGTSWLGSYLPKGPYTLVQGPDDDGFGALIFPLGVTVPAGDMINSFLSIAQVSYGDRKILDWINQENLGKLFNHWSDDPELKNRKIHRVQLWRSHLGGLSKKAENRLGFPFQDKNLAAFIDFYNDFFLSIPVLGMINPDFHDIREGLMYGLFLYHSSYRKRLMEIKKWDDWMKFCNPHECRIIAGALSEKGAIEKASETLKKVLSIPPHCKHLIVSYQDRALGGFYADGRGPFIGVQNTPRGSDRGFIAPGHLQIQQVSPHSCYPDLDPEVEEQIISPKTNLIIRSCGSLATTSGQIYQTRGFNQALGKNPQALKVFIFNLAPERGEGESPDPLETLQKGRDFFKCPIEDFCQVALLGRWDQEIFNREVRIEQRPGESVVVKLLQPNGAKLLEQGILPLTPKIHLSEKRPDLHDPKKLSSLLEKIGRFHHLETQWGLQFSYHQKGPPKKRPYPHLPTKKPFNVTLFSKEITQQMALDFGEKLFSREKFLGPIKESVREKLIFIHQSLACIERFLPPNSLTKKIQKIHLFPPLEPPKKTSHLLNISGEEKVAQKKLAEIKSQLKPEDFIQKDIAFLENLSRKNPGGLISGSQETQKRFNNLQKEWDFLKPSDHFLNLCKGFIPLKELFPIQKGRPYANCLMAIDQETLYISEDFFNPETPPVLNPTWLTGFHYLWAYLTRDPRGMKKGAPLLEELSEKIPFFQNFSPEQRDTLLFSLLLPRGRDLFDLPEEVKEALLPFIPRLNSLFKSRLHFSPKVRREKPLSFQKMNSVLHEFLISQANPLLKKGQGGCPPFPEILPHSRDGLLKLFREKIFPIHHPKKRGKNPNCDPFLPLNQMLNQSTQREELKYEDTLFLNGWLQKIADALPEQGKLNYDTWDKTTRTHWTQSFTTITSDFFSQMLPWNNGIDPFFQIKREGFTRALIEFKKRGSPLPRDFSEAISWLIYGNRRDLFVDEKTEENLEKNPIKNLIQDKKLALEAFENCKTLALFHDNGGEEILSHLGLIQLALNLGKKVISFPKERPYYVSDVTREDMLEIMKILQGELPQFWSQLNDAQKVHSWTLPPKEINQFFTTGDIYRKLPFSFIEYVQKMKIDLMIFCGESHRGLFYGNARGSFLLEKEGIYQSRFGHPAFQLWTPPADSLLLSSVKSPILLRKLPLKQLNWTLPTYQELLNEISGGTVIDFISKDPPKEKPLPLSISF